MIDTSVIIEYLRIKDKESSILFKLLQSYHLLLSPITVFELYNGATTPEKAKDVELICRTFEIVDFNSDTAKIASNVYLKLKQNNKLIEFRDILISASALQHNLAVATINKKHFERIDQLLIINI